jgi:hypothetical protein
MEIEIFGVKGGVEELLLVTFTGDGAEINLRELVVNHDPCCELVKEFGAHPQPICINDYDAIAVKVEGKTAVTIKL